MDCRKRFWKTVCLCEWRLEESGRQKIAAKANIADSKQANRPQTTKEVIRPITGTDREEACQASAELAKKHHPGFKTLFQIGISPYLCIARSTMDGKQLSMPIYTNIRPENARPNLIIDACLAGYSEEVYSQLDIQCEQNHPTPAARKLRFHIGHRAEDPSVSTLKARQEFMGKILTRMGLHEREFTYGTGSYDILVNVPSGTTLNSLSAMFWKLVKPYNWKDGFVAEYGEL